MFDDEVKVGESRTVMGIWLPIRYGSSRYARNIAIVHGKTDRWEVGADGWFLGYVVRRPLGRVYDAYAGNPDDPNHQSVRLDFTRSLLESVALVAKNQAIPTVMRTPDMVEWGTRIQRQGEE